MIQPQPFLQRVATAPISWGVCEVPGWGHQLPPERVLAEMADLGFTATELGSAGWLPTDPAELGPLLGRYGLSLLAAFVPLVLHDADARDDQLAEAERVADLLQFSGARYFNTAPVTSVDWAPRRPYTDEEWSTLVDGLERVGKICANRGLVQVVHEHVGCVIETAADVDRLLTSSSTALVLDTGHLAVGGYDPLDFARRHADRVGLVHLKDTRYEIADRLNAGDVDLMGAVQAGLFPALGQGDLPVAEIVLALEGAGYTGHYVIEQDCAVDGEPPAPGDGPVRDVAISVAYLQRVARGLPSGETPPSGTVSEAP